MTSSSEWTPDHKERKRGRLREDREIPLILSACSLGKSTSRILLLFASFFLLGFATRAILQGFFPHRTAKATAGTGKKQPQATPIPAAETPSANSLHSAMKPCLPEDPVLADFKEKPHRPTRPTPREMTESAKCLQSGRNMAGAGHWEKAIETFERSLQLAKEGSEDHREALLALGGAERETGRFKTAAERFSQAIDLWDDPEARAALERLEKQLKQPAKVPTPPKKGATGLESILLSRQALSEREQEALDWLIQSRNLQEKEKWDEAIQAAERAIQLVTDGTDLHREALLVLGASEWSSGRHSAAHSTFGKVSETWGEACIIHTMQKIDASFTATRK